jgi:diguanylate cyclase (GGDEF)-like protein/PAS domain S-box-containing protein
MFGVPGFWLGRSRVQQALAEQRQAAAHALAEKDAALKALFETGTAGISEVDLVSGRFARVNRRFCEIMRRGADLLLTIGPGDVIYPDDRAAVKAEWMAAMKISGHWEAEVRHIAPDGGAFWVRIGVSVWKRNEAGAPVRCIAVLQDITMSVKVRERLQFSEELLRLGQQVGRIGSFSRDLRTGLLTCGAETSHMLGLASGGGPFSMEVWLAAIVSEDRARVSQVIEQALARREAEIACEYRIKRNPDGCTRHLEMRARYLYDEAGQPMRSVGVVIDVTERKEAEKRLAYAARHDALTGLTNRALFHERVNAAIERLGRGETFAVLYLDLDRFKEVNDTFGHPQGDRLLIEVAGRLRSELRADDTLARLGGDEFAVIQSNLRDPDEAGRLARRLVERIAAPFMLNGQRVSIGTSVGVAIAPRDGAHYEEIVGAADLALYEAKSQPARGWRYFEPQMQAKAQERRELERDLRRALDHGEFELFYQPILDVATLKVKHFEALIRWRRPNKGLTAPDLFIPVAEQIGLIVPLGAWILRRACAEAVSWPGLIGVAVNVSAVQVAAGDLEAVVASALAESGLAAARLELEITETALLNDSENTLATLRQLKAIGVKIVMDDFGAGHSSLGYLQSFPFDKVKIDRVFANGVDCSPKSAAIVKAIIDLCEALEMPTTIEGVETEEQFRAISKLGGKEVQGYLFSPPRPAEEAARLLAQFGGPPHLVRAAE